MDCPRCGAPLSSRDVDCRFCGRGREIPLAPAVNAPAVNAPAVNAPAVNAPAGPAVRTGFWIVSVGANKVSVISVLREHLGLDLREAKDLVDSAPPIRISVEGASGIARILEDLRNAGADARLLLLNRPS